MQTAKQKHKKSRPKLNQGRLLESFDEEDNYILAEDQRMNCMRCGKYTCHDIYGVVAGDEIITVKVITHCRDCGFEVEQNPQPIGKVG